MGPWSFRLRAAALALGAVLACRADNFEPDEPGERPSFSVTQTDTLYPVADSWVRSAPKWENKGALDSLRTKADPANSDTNRTVIRFDQAAIAAQVGSDSLVSAKLQLTIKASGWYQDGNDVAVHRMSLPWVEGGVTWKCGEDLNLSNTSHDCPTTSWAMSGSGTVPFAATPTAQVHLTGGQTGVVEFDVTADVAAFLAGTTNQGWLLKLVDEGRAQRVSYWSREATAAKPRLILTTAEPGAPPPPPADSVLYPVADSWVRSAPKWENKGAQDSLRTKADPANSDTNRTVLRFDQAAIAAYVGTGTLTQATLELTVKASGWYQDGNDVAVHRLTMPWAEGGVTWKCGEDLDLSNTIHDCPTTGWAMSGSGTVPFVATPTAQAHLNGGQTGVIQFNVTADVQAFLNGTTNRGWVFKLVDESRAQRVSYWSREATAKPRLILRVNSVPASAPNTTPAWFRHDSSYTAGEPRHLKHVLGVVFQEGTTQAQRQAAVDSVAGRVLGGWRFSSLREGTYAVQVADSGSDVRMQQFIEKLRTLSQVKFAAPILTAGLTYRRPHDGTGWQRHEWRLSPDNLSASPRWGLEAIAAPLAWGCTTGSTDARIVVADQNFVATEIAGNLRSPLPPVTPGDPLHHGTAMANIIAARGNDSTGMTGVMWHAAIKAVQLPGYNGTILPLYDAAQNVLDELQGQETVIINLSIGLSWDTLPGHRRNTRAQDSLNVATVFGNIGYNMTGRNPNALLVISAGNLGLTGPGPQYQDSLDAWWSGWTQLKDSLANQTLVVGASRIGGTRSKLSSLGPMPDIYAPGEAVYTYDPLTLSIGPINGASAATAYVTGVAGLLASFDPRLTGPEIRALIREGADSGKRIIPSGTHQRKLLNAYEALRAAARRSGAPLCGNRVWANNFALRAERGTSIHSLATLGEEAGYVNVHHGGKRVDVAGWDLGDRAFLWNNGAWSEAADYWSLPAGSPGGAFNAAVGLSHDQDSVVALRYATNGGSTTHSVYVYPRGASQPNSPLALVAISHFSSLERTCRHERYKADSARYLCADSSASVGSSTFAGGQWVAYSPLGDRVYFLASIISTMASAGEMQPCPWSATVNGIVQERCRSVNQSQSSVGVNLYEIKLRDSSATLLGTVSGRTAAPFIGVREDNTEFVLNTGVMGGTVTIEPYMDVIDTTKKGFRTVGQIVMGDCRVEFRSAAAFHTAIRSEPMGSRHGCDQGWMGPGTIAPLRGPLTGARPRVSPPTPTSAAPSLLGRLLDILR